MSVVCVQLDWSSGSVLVVLVFRGSNLAEGGRSADRGWDRSVVGGARGLLAVDSFQCC